MTNGTCTVPECDKPLRSRYAQWCKMHYHRWYRHGSTDKVSVGSGLSVSHGRRYRTVTAKGHPLASKNGTVYEHRKVLFDTIGPGPHACHWCDTTVQWLRKGEPGALVVDHLNGYGDDNRPDNLVPSCYGCNTARALQARSDLLRELGWWSNNDTVAALARGGRRDRVEAAASWG